MPEGGRMKYEIHDAILTRKDVAKILRCSDATLTRLIRIHAIPDPFRDGGRHCWCQYRFAEWIAAGRPVAT